MCGSAGLSSGKLSSCTRAAAGSCQAVAPHACHVAASSLFPPWLPDPFFPRPPPPRPAPLSCRSRYQLEYSQAQGILEGRPLGAGQEVASADRPALQRNLTLLAALAEHRRQARLQAGAMELESAELRFNTGPDGQPTTVTVKQARLSLLPLSCLLNPPSCRPRLLLRSGACPYLPHLLPPSLPYPSSCPAFYLQEIPMMRIVAEMMIFANAAVGQRVAAAFPRAALLRRHPPPRKEAVEEVSEQPRGGRGPGRR